MKKAILYGFAVLGVLAVLTFLFKSLSQVSGSTMYGSAPQVQLLEQPQEASASRMQQYSMDNTNSSISLTGGVGAKPSNVPTYSAIKRMIIRNTNLTLEVKNLRQATEQITQLANNSGGYVVNSNLNDNGAYSSANISIRVPAEGLENALSVLKHLAVKVLQVQVTGEDITQQYVDLESSVKNLQTAKSQLEKIMNGAKKTEDVLTVFRQLSDTQGRIDVLEGQIKYFKESSAFSLLTISLQTMYVRPPADSWTISKVAKGAYHSLLVQLQKLAYGVIQFFILYLPLILIWSSIILLVYFVLRKIYRCFN